MKSKKNYNEVADESSSESFKKKTNRKIILNEEEIDDDIEINKKRKKNKKNLDLELTDEEAETARRKETDPLNITDRQKK